MSKIISKIEGVQYNTFLNGGTVLNTNTWIQDNTGNPAIILRDFVPSDFFGKPFRLFFAGTGPSGGPTIDTQLWCQGSIFYDTGAITPVSPSPFIVSLICEILPDVASSTGQILAASGVITNFDGTVAPINSRVPFTLSGGTGFQVFMQPSSFGSGGVFTPTEFFAEGI